MDIDALYKKIESLNRFQRKISSILYTIGFENQRAGYGDDMDDLEPTYGRLVSLKNVLSSTRAIHEIAARMRDDPNLYSDSPGYSTITRQMSSLWMRNTRTMANSPGLTIEDMIIIFDGMEDRFLNDAFIRDFVNSNGDNEELANKIQSLSLWAITTLEKIKRINRTLVVDPEVQVDDDEEYNSNEEEDISDDEEDEEEESVRHEREEALDDEDEEDLVDEGDEEADGGPKCNDIIMFDELGIKKYLARNPKNFVIGLVKPSGEIIYECQSLKNLKLSNKIDPIPRDRSPYTSFLECKDETPERLQGSYAKWLMPQGRTFVKMYSSNLMVIKPDWLWDGPVPEPRVFLLEQVGDVYKFVTSEAAPTMTTYFNAVGKDHCNQKGRVPVYRLVPATLTADGYAPTTTMAATGGKKRKNKRAGGKTKRNKRAGGKTKRNKRAGGKTKKNKKKVTKKHHNHKNKK